MTVTDLKKLLTVIENLGGGDKPILVGLEDDNPEPIDIVSLLEQQDQVIVNLNY